MDNLFLDCHMSRRAYDLATQHDWIPAGLLASGPTLGEQLHGLRSWFSFCMLLQKLSILLWSIWKGRNHLVFRNENFIPLACLVSAKKSYAEWRIRSCISIDDYYRGYSSSPPLPPLILLDGSRHHRGRSKSTSMALV